MPTKNIDLKPSNDRLPNVAGELSEGGMLISLTARLHEGTAQSGTVHVQLGTYRDTVAEANWLCVLVDDYVYDGHNPSWAGKLPLEPGEGIMAVVRSGTIVTVRCTAKVLRYDP